MVKAVDMIQVICVLRLHGTLPAPSVSTERTALIFRVKQFLDFLTLNMNALRSFEARGTRTWHPRMNQAEKR